ncbi:integrase core domain-containing protein [Acetobacter persici]|uniref:integrase core domain-containing protein n=1 Tax=Acetobacter persici TaxID=1076596 RepID=UPI001BA44C42|nr:transposase [Acetobacter persici]
MKIRSTNQQSTRQKTEIRQKGTQSTVLRTLQVLADWRKDYNTVRPHSQLDGRTPDQIARQVSRGHVSLSKLLIVIW